MSKRRMAEVVRKADCFDEVRVDGEFLREQGTFMLEELAD
jgi:hypothetical protein